MSLPAPPRREPSFCGRPFPAILAAAGSGAMCRFIEFFTANIRNTNTRAAYACAVAQFCAWCERRTATEIMLYSRAHSSALRRPSKRSLAVRSASSVVHRAHGM